MSVRVRFAPSPTGDLHLGAIRAAVFNYLFARHMGGTFIFRLEDTDQKREKEGSAEGICKALNWLGITPDEGVYLDDQGKLSSKGPFGPYIQSERLPIYHDHVNVLLDTGKAYRCFCSAERLTEMRGDQEENHLPPRYDRLCRALSRAESDLRAENGESFVVRQAMPEGEEVVFEDMIKGTISFNSKDLDDHVLLKSDGFPTYQLANVVDDHLMEISHVLRGDEWIPSTPKNLLLYKAFGWQAPQYAHLPVILSPDKKHKLSKRDGAEPVLSYAARGYLPDGVLNFLAFLGWSPGTEEEFFLNQELCERFQLEKVQKAAAVFDPLRLDFVNGWHIRHLQLGEVVERMIPYWEEAVLVVKDGDSYLPAHETFFSAVTFSEHLLAIASAVQEKMKHFDETVSLTEFFFLRPETNFEIIIPKKGDLETTKNIVREALVSLEAISPTEWVHAKLEEVLRAFIAEKGYKAMDVLWPIRAILTGKPASPGAFEMLAVLGREESILRLRQVVG